MSNARTYVKKLLVGTLLVIVVMVLAPPLMLILLFLFSSSISSQNPVFMWRIGEDAGSQLMAVVQGVILIVTLLGFFIWMMKGHVGVGYGSERRRYLTVTVVYTLLLCCGFTLAGTNLFGPQYGRCEFYNSPTTLNAGRKDFNGVVYEIRVCGSAPRPQDGDNDRLELTVLDEHGEMLARRHYSVNWQAGISFHEPLQYEKDAVMAVNAFGEDIRIQIPPSRFDWLRARIPPLD
ncbi:hypothetical protein [Herbaspirillum rubrisubalbicans]|uniref:hypothetical protein n=1 Tax=Herbaspirillum rubrisubalbicans TaxID=80842 RepID=UPI0015C57B32|nr:hypothetical protein [Herbaspirillum rubrisubalbicans]